MQQLTIAVLDELLEDHQPPCISLYMPTTRLHPVTNTDTLRFKNLLSRVEEELRQAYSARETRPLIEKVGSIAVDDRFWNRQLDGLAIFCSQDLLRTVQLQRPVIEHHTVADSFHLKPLMRILQTNDRYQILCITQSDVRLYEGNRDVLDEVELINVPRNLAQAEDLQSTQPQAIRSDYGTPGAGEGIHAGRDEIDPGLQRFFRMVDREIWENHSRVSGLPLILATFDQYHPLFRAVTRNPNLIEPGIRINPHAISSDRLRQEAWQLVEPFYRERAARLSNDFQVAKSRQLGSDQVEEVARAAAMARVSTLLVDANRHIGGKLDSVTGDVQWANASDPTVDDLLDDAAEKVLKTGGSVLVIPPELMPTDSGVAAIYRY